MGRLFGTDGIRGVANKELTPELAFKLGKAGAYVLTKEKRRKANIIIGMDTRESGDMLEAALIAGMCSVGANVIPLGVIPTPGMAYLVRHYKMDAGVVISASHNPSKDNGIKFFSSEGYKLSDSLEDEIEDIIKNSYDSLPNPSENLGRKMLRHDAVLNYVDFIVDQAEDINLEGMKVAIDCANGATYQAAPMVMKNLGADVHTIHASPDGININKNCGSTHMTSLVEYVRDNHMDIGIAFDGDGDRCLMVDENGKIVEGDEMMSIFATYFKKEGILKNDTLVATVMSNLGLFHMGEKNGINIERASVGDRYVLERMLEIGACLGGEQSGHIIFLDHNTTGDGILTAVQMLKIMHKTGQKLSELNTVMKVLPQVLINAKVKEENKKDFDKNHEINSAVAEVSERFKDRGRVLIRASGTEPLVRVMIEGEDPKELEKEARKVADLIERILG
ncbi:phosphoglucosamine mutase [Anaeropeptidivorans aminofermentans]|uniref:phosphoglucosamine mutase n=1 Tax=Anaeropeptidivorans aminofermentans TaxID=2934315 RepID=UPI0020242C8F|nr:phosphoglucosamine mutase [Anaeropeptidivorans aminofermentans]